MNFTIQELQDAVQDFPVDGFFCLAKEKSSPAIFYEFICDKNFTIKSEHYETIDVSAGSSWMEISCVGTLEEINKSIEMGEFEKFRYIVLA